ncbi:MAG TPA: KTSC domain-containing protein [bacterium]|nr:KTSC domain-containing protein [bacterium]
MKREPIDSSSARSVGYDPEREILEVEFPDGDVYRYFEVSAEDYADLRMADSFGEHLNHRIKPFHDYERVSL